MSLTDETIDRIIEIVKIDAEIVADTAKQRPYAAWKLAQQSLDTRMPIFQWVVRYNIEKFQVKAYELAWNNSASLRNMAPAAAADLAWQRSRLEQRLHRHRRELRAALKALQPALEERLLEAAREDPKRIPGIGAGLLRSGWYRVSWNANKRMLRAFPGAVEGALRGDSRRPRAQVDRPRGRRAPRAAPQWIVDAGAAWKGPETTAADIFQRQAASWMSPLPTLEPPRAAAAAARRGAAAGGRRRWCAARALAELRVALATTQGVLGIFVKTALVDRLHLGALGLGGALGHQRVRVAHRPPPRLPPEQTQRRAKLGVRRRARRRGGVPGHVSVSDEPVAPPVRAQRHMLIRLHLTVGRPIRG